MYDSQLSLRHRLRHETAASHAALEARIGPLTTQSAYNEYVRGLHEFRVSAEEWLAMYGLTGVGAWKPQNIAAVLYDDLKALALQPLAHHSLDWSADESFALGAHYVLEGSSLGARVLCKQVAALGMTRDHGARHLWAQAETSNWRAFTNALNAHEGDDAALIAGADAAFGAAAASMERAAHA